MWDEWIEKHPRATVDQIEAQLSKMAKKCGIEEYVAKAKG